MVGKIIRVSGPVVFADVDGSMNDLVKVGNDELLGEIIQINKTNKVIQVYEDTVGLMPGDKVVCDKAPLSVQLAPGILGKVFDGTQRPLDLLGVQSDFIEKGAAADPLDTKVKWSFVPSVAKGDVVSEGDVLGTVKENSTITHKVLVPVGVSGKVDSIEKGDFTIIEKIASIEGEKVCMLQKWPVRKARKVKEKLFASRPLISGSRVLDFLFPLAKGGVAAIPGPFGAGKTVTQQQFAKWCDADLIVYVGCGERGNEMTEVLTEFPELKDPNTGEPLMNRTILIANTSNMPVAAREASVYTGMTIAEYFRDQGFDVALMADSTSRWAEAMREISGRLEEMPGEEGFPAYLSKRLSQFYERGGIVSTLGGFEGSVSTIGAVSPPGGDFSEPVTQNTLRIVRAFWALDAGLADKRHYPTINWLTSYSLYHGALHDWFKANMGSEWFELRDFISGLLQEEKELQDLAQIVGSDSLPYAQQVKLFTGKVIREDFLQQNAFDPIDTFCSMNKTKNMALVIKSLFETLNLKTCDLDSLRSSSLMSKVASLKYVKDEDVEKEVAKINDLIQNLVKGDKYE